MLPELLNYTIYQEQAPQSGHHILAHQTEDEILVYQAYNDNIANFAIENQCLGGSHFKYSRMSWIKPNFLWMMFRCGWCEKINQERVLGIWIKKASFDKILSNAVYSSFQESIYNNHENWKEELSNRNVRLQWDPDHDAFGKKLDRRAVQLGLKDDILLEFGGNMITKIIDMTDLIKNQKKKIDNGLIDEVLVPKEWAYTISNVELKKKLKID